MFILNFLRRIKQNVFRERLTEMVSGYKNADGKFLKYTRISNNTYIGHKQKLNIGDNVFIGHFNFIDASNGMTIGEGCQITNYVSLITHSSHISIRLLNKNYVNYSDPPGYIKGSITLGDYTFVGPHCVIMPGSKIGRGCIVSAFSYVQGTFPDFSVIAGQPAKVIGTVNNMDQNMLQHFPELKSNYEAWYQNKP